MKTSPRYASSLCLVGSLLMKRKNYEHVRLAPADWGGLLSVALALATLVSATLYKVHEVAQTNRERLAAVDAELSALRRNVTLLQSDVRQIARRD